MTKLNWKWAAAAFVVASLTYCGIGRVWVMSEAQIIYVPTSKCVKPLPCYAEAQ